MEATKGQRRRDRLPALMMGLQGLLVVGMWIGYAIGGVFKDGLKTVENRQYLAFHVLAETLMGLSLITGSAGLLRGRSWGRTVGFVGLGATIYSTINSLADTVRSKPQLTPVLLVNLVIAVISAALLAARR